MLCDEPMSPGSSVTYSSALTTFLSEGKCKLKPYWYQSTVLHKLDGHRFGK
jgi:hypothetical protein